MLVKASTSSLPQRWFGVSTQSTGPRGGMVRETYAAERTPRKDAWSSFATAPPDKAFLQIRQAQSATGRAQSTPPDHARRTPYKRTSGPKCAR